MSDAPESPRPWRWFFLRPYGDSLELPAARAFFTFCGWLIAATCVMEAAAWGYATSLIFPGERGPPILVGVIIAAVIWAVDVSLVTLDKDPGRASRRTAEKMKTRDVLLAKVREYGVPSLRVVWAVVSLATTAPFVALKVVEERLEGEATAQYIREAAAERTALVEKAQAEVDRHVALVEQYTEAAVAEADGKGASKQRNCGSICRAKQAAAAASRSDLEAARTALAGVTSLSDTEVAARAGITRPVDSLADRLTRAQQMTDSGFVIAERNVQVFLLLLLGGLFLLKFVGEPEAVRIYLSAHYQDEWQNRYLKGVYDPSIPDPLERSTGARMGVFRFAAFVDARCDEMAARDTQASRLQDAERTLRKPVEEAELGLDAAVDVLERAQRDHADAVCSAASKLAEIATRKEAKADAEARVQALAAEDGDLASELANESDFRSALLYSRQRVKVGVERLAAEADTRTRTQELLEAELSNTAAAQELVIRVAALQRAERQLVQAEAVLRERRSRYEEASKQLYNSRFVSRGARLGVVPDLERDEGLG